MKITKSQLKQIIKEELSAILGEDGGTASCEDLLKQLRHAEAEMKQHDPRNFGAMAGGQMPMYDADAAYDEAAGNYNRIKAQMEDNGCPMP
jgi:hypothetical protein